MMVDLLNRLAYLSKEEASDIEYVLRNLCLQRQYDAGVARVSFMTYHKQAKIKEADALYDRATSLYMKFIGKEFK